MSARLPMVQPITTCHARHAAHASRVELPRVRVPRHTWLPGRYTMVTSPCIDATCRAGASVEPQTSLVELRRPQAGLKGMFVTKRQARD